MRVALQTERQIGCILYLTSGVEVLLHLVHELEPVPKKLAFANAKDFAQTLLEHQVMTAGTAERQVPGAAAMNRDPIGRLSIAISLPRRCLFRASFAPSARR